MIIDGDFTAEQLLLTTVQAAKVLGIGRTTVYELMKVRDLHPVHVGRSCRISWAELERYISRLEGDHPAEATASAGRVWRRAVDGSGHQAVFPVHSHDRDGGSAA